MACASAAGLKACATAADVKAWLGISGDTACADHEIAKRVRHLAQLDPEKGEFADHIIFTSVDRASPFEHPLFGHWPSS